MVMARVYSTAQIMRCRGRWGCRLNDTVVDLFNEAGVYNNNRKHGWHKSQVHIKTSIQ